MWFVAGYEAKGFNKGKAMKKIFLYVLFGLTSVLFGGCETKGDRLVSVVSNSIDKVVIIRVDAEKNGMKGTVVGSGVFIDSKGLVLTCAHLFNDFNVKGISVINYGDEVVAGKVVFISTRKDLALVKTWALSPTSYAKVADPRNLKVGQEVFAIGNPKDVGISVTSGIISRLNCDFEWAYNVTQSDTAINPGNSGGPLFNLKGELVGINSFLVSGTNVLPVFTGLGFSVSSGQIIEFLAQYRKAVRMAKREHK